MPPAFGLLEPFAKGISSIVINMRLFPLNCPRVKSRDNMHLKYALYPYIIYILRIAVSFVKFL